MMRNENVTGDFKAKIRFKENKKKGYAWGMKKTVSI